MQDTLFKFPSETASLHGMKLMGAVNSDDEPILATFAFAQAIIGEHMVPTGAIIDTPQGPVPEMDGDGKHWVLFRALEDVPVPNVLNAYVAWRSTLTDANGVPIPRPTTPDVPQQVWL